jgi:CHAD domain-containing protein
MSLDRNRLSKSVNKLRKFLRKGGNSLRPQEVHDFRTHARRLEAMMEALGLGSKGKYRRLLRDVARLRKRAGKVRDMDVLTGHALTVRIEDEQDCSVELLECLGAERYQQAKKLAKQVENSRQVLRERMKRSSAHIDSLLTKRDKKQIQAKNKAQAETMASALQLSSHLKTPPRLNKGNLHSYRLQVKQLRYVLQMSEAANHQKFINRLGVIKDAIGEWHDWEELSTLATDLLYHGSTCKLLRELKTICREKYDRALSLTNEMRDAYLPELENAGRKKNKQSRRLARPVLTATSAIME